MFGEPGRNVIDWELIERHYDDLMRVVLSVAAGTISSVTLLRRLSTYSRRNNFYKAFREVGRVVRTIQLLRLARWRNAGSGPGSPSAEHARGTDPNATSSWCTSVITRWPPGRRIRANSVIAGPTSERWVSANAHATTSTWSSGMGSSCKLPCRSSACGTRIRA
jgi:hypothetical protein